MQDWASSGVKKFEVAGGDSAWRDVALMTDDEMRGLMGANASTVDARAIKMARVEGDALIFMVHCFLCWLRRPLIYAIDRLPDLSSVGVRIGIPRGVRREQMNSTWTISFVCLASGFCSKIFPL